MDAAAPKPPPPWALLRSLTWKRNARSSVESATSALHPDGAVAVAGDAQHDELERFGRRDTDLGNELTGIEHALRVELVVAAHEDRLPLGGAAERVYLVEPAQIALEQVAHVGAQRGAVRLEDRPLHLPIERAPQHRHQAPHVELPVARIAAQRPRRGEPDAVPLAEEHVDADRVELIVAGGRDVVVELHDAG